MKLDIPESALEETILPAAIGEAAQMKHSPTFIRMVLTGCHRVQAQQSKLARRWGAAKQRPAEETALARSLRDASDIEMCLVVRAARNLPIRLLAREYERILRRRLRVVGGSPDDPALAAMIGNLRCSPPFTILVCTQDSVVLNLICSNNPRLHREERLPAHIKDRGSVRRGSVIAFTRSRHGQLTAIAGGVGLGSVSSEKLAQAVFDIYLGRQASTPPKPQAIRHSPFRSPHANTALDLQAVSADGRRAAGESFLRMLGESEFQPPKGPLLCNANVCAVGKL